MNRYKFYYDSTEKFVTKARETFIDAPNPVSALNQFHRLLQLKVGTKAKDYKLKKLALFYNSDAWGARIGLHRVRDRPPCVRQPRSA